MQYPHVLSESLPVTQCSSQRKIQARRNVQILLFILICFRVLFFAEITQAEEAASMPEWPGSFSVVSFNVNAIDAEFPTLKKQFQRMGAIDLWGLSEVDPDWAPKLKQIFNEAQFDLVMGKSGREQRLAMIINKDKFSIVRFFELEEINPKGKVRAPLVAELKLKSSGLLFYLMVNHLYRSDNEARVMQAKQLNAWAATQKLPVIAIGDYNFDWSLKDGTRDVAFDEMAKGDVFDWIIPRKLVPTHCSRYESILDFVWVSGVAQKWQAQSQILFSHARYCPDTYQKSDHRPVKAIFLPQ